MFFKIIKILKNFEVHRTRDFYTDGGLLKVAHSLDPNTKLKLSLKIDVNFTHFCRYELAFSSKLLKCQGLSRASVPGLQRERF